MIWAIILAAGESKRMGRPKMLLPFGGKTIIEAVIDQVSRSKADRILVVLGAEKEEIEKLIKPLQVRTAFNPDFQKGMLSSVQVGFKALPKDAEAAVVLLGDQPSVSVSVIDTVIDVFIRSNKGIVVPVHKDYRGHPVCIDAKFRDEIQNLHHTVGLREILHRHPDEVFEKEIDDPAILRDMDDEQDYHRELKKRGNCLKS